MHFSLCTTSRIFINLQITQPFQKSLWSSIIYSTCQFFVHPFGVVISKPLDRDIIQKLKTHWVNSFTYFQSGILDHYFTFFFVMQKVASSWNSLGILLIGYSQRIFKVLLHHFLCRRGTPKWVVHYFKKLVLQLFLKCPFFGVRGTIKKKIKPGNFFLSGLWRFLVVTAFFRNDHPQTNNFVNDVTNHRKSGFMIGIWTLHLLRDMCNKS